MTASRHPHFKLSLTLCFAILLGLGAWLAVVLLSQLALMEPVTAAAAQSLAGNGGALRFVPAGAAATGAEAAAAANYASARLWVWFCICANGIGAVLLGLWLREATRVTATPAPIRPAAQAAPRGKLIERAMHSRGAHGVGGAAPGAIRSRPGPASSCSGDAAARLARVARIIDNLAFQTTLLAVNAAVEAERGSRMPPRA
ncbi:hypothetical protein INH39_31020 [Massilia violaceinigra]|uniref:Methyl-accepting transducer domain-containing protein n=1 Tax=Massilia violaceinigra TaxID=2045208 RepID=A0ABY4A4U9_9BURK|nr:hypothetical protein [Massilia violaceinigra]UOD29761.1 hypothetical protein INH39_31020 [Massilia violaceinigra]